MTYVCDSFRATEDPAPLSPEQRLWQSVLMCAVRDLRAGGNFADAVKRWMLTKGKDEDYRRVCELADIDPDAFRRTVVRYIESNYGQLSEPCSVDDVILSKKPFSPLHLGVPAHEVIERIKELRAEGARFSRLHNGVYLCTSLGVRKPIVERNNRKADSLILSGKPFDAGPVGSYVRYRIEYHRRKGRKIASLGKRKFLCETSSQIISGCQNTSHTSLSSD